MNLKQISKMSDSEMYASLQYFGIAVQGHYDFSLEGYQDLEMFIFRATVFRHTPRTLEGLIAWIKRYGHLLSPSKMRRLIQKKIQHRSAFLGSICDMIQGIHHINFKIVMELCNKEPLPVPLTPTPISLIRSRNKVFESWGLIVTAYEANEDKFLLPIKYVLRDCVELRNRILMGSVVNSDINSFLAKSNSKKKYSLYEISEHIYSQRSSVSRAMKIRFDGLV